MNKFWVPKIRILITNGIYVHHFHPGTELGILACRLTEASGDFLFRKINQFKSKNIFVFQQQSRHTDFWKMEEEE
jgi:hypothetical protein